jgi:hypothetical protein
MRATLLQRKQSACAVAAEIRCLGEKAAEVVQLENDFTQFLRSVEQHFGDGSFGSGRTAFSPAVSADQES